MSPFDLAMKALFCVIKILLYIQREILEGMFAELPVEGLKRRRWGGVAANGNGEKVKIYGVYSGSRL